MTKALPIVCIPGLGCSPRLYAEQIPQLWTVGPVTIAQHEHHESMAAIARSILASAPERFALIGDPCAPITGRGTETESNNRAPWYRSSGADYPVEPCG
jgi:hypothetical protein